MTFAEFEQLPDLDAGKRELVDGEVVTMPPPELNRSETAQRVQYFL
jgi:Uma2 family endonuclease